MYICVLFVQNSINVSLCYFKSISSGITDPSSLVVHEDTVVYIIIYRVSLMWEFIYLHWVYIILSTGGINTHTSRGGTAWHMLVLHKTTWWCRLLPKLFFVSMHVLAVFYLPSPVKGSPFYLVFWFTTAAATIVCQFLNCMFSFQLYLHAET